jgi:single-strand DNA-binding protein
MNNCVFVGNLTRDPELKYVGELKTPVCSFGLAIHSGFKNKSGEKETIFLDMDAWGPRAELIAKYCVKGRQLSVMAAVVQDNWVAKDGSKRSKLKFKVNDFTFINDGKGGVPKPDSEDTVGSDNSSAEEDSPF